MKKGFVIIAAVVLIMSVMFTNSCNNTESVSTQPTPDSTTVVVDSVAVDTVTAK